MPARDPPTKGLLRGQLGVSNSASSAAIGAGEAVKIACPVMPLAVDEEGRRSVHAALQATHEVAAHLRSERARLKGFAQSFLGKVQSLGKIKVKRQPQLFLVLVESVVDVPEMPVGAREFRGFRRALRLRVDLRQRKIAKHEAKLFAEMRLHRLDDGKGSPASGTLIVSVLDERDGGMRIALGVIG